MDDFNSCFAEKLNEYVSFRHTLGFSGIHHRCLKFFDEYCVTFHPNERAITAPLVKGWIKHEINAGRGNIESKQSAIRAFAKFVGNDSYILTELYHVQKKDFNPYLLSEKELSALELLFDYIKTQKGIPLNKLTFEDINRDTISDFLLYLENDRNAAFLPETTGCIASGHFTVMPHKRILRLSSILLRSKK